MRLALLLEDSPDTVQRAVKPVLVPEEEIQFSVLESSVAITAETTATTNTVNITCQVLTDRISLI